MTNIIGIALIILATNTVEHTSGLVNVISCEAAGCTNHPHPFWSHTGPETVTTQTFYSIGTRETGEIFNIWKETSE